MNVQGQLLLQAVRQVRGYFGEVSVLLRTVDAAMNAEGWTTEGNGCLYDMSYTIQQPDRWMPAFICRHYTNKQHANVWATACVVVEYLEAIPKPVVEPLLIGQVFTFPAGLNRDKWLTKAQYANWHVWLPDRQDDGSVSTIDPRKQWPEEKTLAEEMKSFARPLVEFADEQAVKTLFVSPLAILAKNA